MKRRIVVFGFDTDESEMKFEWIDVPPEKDISFAKVEALKETPFRRKGACEYEDLKSCFGLNKYFMVYVPSTGAPYAGFHYDAYDLIHNAVVCEGGGWIVNFHTQETEFIHVPNWSERDKATNAEEAMLYMTTFLSKDFGRLNESKLKEVQDYADKHGVPFSADFMSMFKREFNTYQPQWDSSSAYC